MAVPSLGFTGVNFWCSPSRPP
ncbi:hypothetical protein ACIBU0_34395 [Streptomyces sp. NPDC049627]